MAKETKMNIFRSLCRLFDEHTMDDITVTMLVQECDISRQTFYYHFSDIESLLRWGIDHGTASAVQKAKQATNMREATEVFFTMLESGRDVIANLLNSSYSGYVTLLIKDSVKQYISKFAVRFADESIIKSPDASFLLDFVSNGITGGILASYYENTEIDVETTTDRLNTLIFEKYITE